MSQASATGLAAMSARSARLWHFVDARNQVLGRLAPQISRLLMGKHKPTYVPSVDAGDYVVVVNAADVALTGKKRMEKLYRWHTGWMGGLKTLTARQMFERDPTRVVNLAVKGMMPDNNLRDVRLTRLRIFPNEQHDHKLQINMSAAYAPQHIAVVAPKLVTPRGVTTITAAAGPPLAEDPEAAAALEKSFVKMVHNVEFAAKYDAWRLNRTTLAQKARDARDAAIASRIV